MCPRPALLAGLLLGLLAGCVGKEADRRAAWNDQFHSFGLAHAPNVVQVDVALLERRVGDTYVNRDVWDFTDEQVVDLDRKLLLGENGFRVGQVVGLLPAGLHAMLKSERCCLNPRCFLLPAGQERTVYLGTVRPVCRYSLSQGGEATPVELPQAQCGLVITPTLTADGRTRLRFVPKVEYGETVQQVHAARDRSGWVLEVQRPHKDHRELAWEVTLAPNDYLIIGGLFDREGSLGRECFVDREAVPPVQRLLVLRTVRSGGGVDSEIAAPPLDARPDPPRTPPLALQATLPVTRAYSR